MLLQNLSFHDHRADHIAIQDMADVRKQLQQIKQENHELERELRSNANAEQKARLLEAKVAEVSGKLESDVQVKCISETYTLGFARIYFLEVGWVTRGWRQRAKN